MAAPVVEGTAESATTSAGTSHAVTLPASIAASDLVLIIMDIGSTSATLNALTDWTESLDEASANGLKIIRYTGAGVPSNPTFTSSASTKSASIAYRISGADKSTAPQIGTTSTGTSTTPDPPSVTPTGGISKDYLFITFFGSAGEEADDDTWVNSAPTNYGNLVQKTAGTAGTNLGGLIGAANRALTTGSAENPGTFSIDTSAAWRAQTIIIHPSGDATASPAAIAATMTLPAVSATGGGATDTFGYHITGGGSDATADNWINECTINATYRYTAQTGDTVTRVHTVGGGTGTCEVGVYTYSGGVPVTRVGTANISVGSTDQEYGTDVSWALTDGVEYVVGIDWDTGGASWTMHFDDPGGTNTSIGNSQNALPATWTQNSTSSGLGTFWATVTHAGGSEDGTATPAAIAATASLPAAQTGAGASASPAAIATSATLPTATEQGGASASPAAITATVAMETAELDTLVALDAAITATVTIPQASTGASATATPAATTLVVTLPDPTDQGGATRSPAAVATTVTLPAPMPQAGSTRSPAAIPAPVTLPAVTASGGSAGTASPAAIPAPLAIPAATPQAGSTATPAAIPVIVTLPQASATGGSQGTANPAAIAATMTLLAVTPLAGSTAQPAAIAAPATLPPAAAGAAQTATPAAIGVVVAIPQASGQGGTSGTATPTAIAATVILPAVQLNYGSTATPAAITLLLEIPSPLPPFVIGEAVTVVIGADALSTLIDLGESSTVTGGDALSTMSV